MVDGILETTVFINDPVRRNFAERLGFTVRAISGNIVTLRLTLEDLNNDWNYKK